MAKNMDINKQTIMSDNSNKYIGKQQKGLKRNTIDKYYTKKIVVNLCADVIKQHINFEPNDLIIEPSAGNGSFIECIKTFRCNYLFYDIEPENDEIIKQDFLHLEIDEIAKNYNNIHIIGNPPFGRQSAIAIKFIKKCCKFANTISFILPKSFKKYSMQNHFTNFYHLIKSIDLNTNSFLVNGIETDVPCVFQIWKLSNEHRNQTIKQIPINFKFVKKNELPDLSFRRVGVNAGTIDKNSNEKSPQSHYFIKFTNNYTTDENIELLKNLHFNFDNTVGPKSISKPELIDEFNKLLI